MMKQWCWSRDWSCDLSPIAWRGHMAWCHSNLHWVHHWRICHCRLLCIRIMLWNFSRSILLRQNCVQVPMQPWGFRLYQGCIEILVILYAHMYLLVVAAQTKRGSSRSGWTRPPLSLFTSPRLVKICRNTALLKSNLITFLVAFVATCKRESNHRLSLPGQNPERGVVHLYAYVWLFLHCYIHVHVQCIVLDAVVCLVWDK